MPDMNARQLFLQRFEEAVNRPNWYARPDQARMALDHLKTLEFVRRVDAETALTDAGSDKDDSGSILDLLDMTSPTRHISPAMHLVYKKLPRRMSEWKQADPHLSLKNAFVKSLSFVKSRADMETIETKRSPLQPVTESLFMGVARELPEDMGDTVTHGTFLDLVVDRALRMQAMPSRRAIRQATDLSWTMFDAVKRHYAYSYSPAFSK